MKVAFFHGLESNEKSEKSQYLKSNFNAWCPAMDYRNPKLFDEVLAHINSDKPDLLIGSSMGGWFAYCLSTLTGIPTLLLNPAVQGRSMEPKVHLGNMKAKHTVVLGSEDIVIDPAKTKSWLKSNCKGAFEIHMERIGHRTPNPIMVKHLKVNEDWSTESPGESTAINILPESVNDLLRNNAFASRPPISGNWTVEDQRELADVIRCQRGLSDDDIKFAQRVAKSPVDEFYTYLILRGQKINRKEIEDIWNDKPSIDLVGRIKDTFKRSRPYWIHSEVNYIPDTGSADYSFPSGHATGSWRIAIRLSSKFPHLRDGLENIARRISDSRVYSGVHYPSDIKFGKELALILEKN